MSDRILSAQAQNWPIEGEFRISRGAKREAVVVVATITAGSLAGRGECLPYGRYGETPESVLAEIAAMGNAIAAGLTRRQLCAQMPAGAARNAIDCALWDLEAKLNQTSAAEMAGLPTLRPLTTAYTISLGPADEMAARAKSAGRFPLLKLKLGGNLHGGPAADDDGTRMQAVRAARPDARLIVDGNEAYRAEMLAALMASAKTAGIELIEQPLPAGADQALAGLSREVPVCADESMHLGGDIEALLGRYDAVNIKLDKTGGLTEAMQTMRDARQAGLRIMVGCMVATSLSMAPAFLLAQHADWVDLDGPLLLAKDRREGLRYRDALVEAPTPELWG